jgi:diguanylate cyclase (GGDEF)-like protein
MTNSKKLIALMGAMIDEEKNSNLIREMEKECRKNGYFMLVFGFSETSFWSQDRNNNEMKLIEIASHLDLKAIIVHLEFIKNAYLVEAIRELANKMQIPLIAMEKATPGCINISMRYVNGFADMVRHVIEVHGCRKINMMAGIKGDHFSDDRIEAYKLVLEEYGIPFEESRLGYGDFWDRPAREATRKFLESGDIPEAIVCANDNMAIAVCDELQKSGYRVPEDIIVTGFDGIKKCLFKSPAISTVEPDYTSEARKLIELIMNNEGRPDAEDAVYIDFLLKLRESCGCKRSRDVLSSTDIKELSDSYDDVNWAVTSINTLFYQASHLDSLCKLSSVIQDTMWLWERGFQFVGVDTELLRPEMSDLGNEKYTTFFGFKDGKRFGIGQSYNEDVLFPDFNDIIENCSFGSMVIKLIHAGERVFGYVVEGSDHTSNRDIKRCEELGMFLSTSINTVFTNRNLTMMHREIEKISVLDYLTGIFNRRGFFNELHRLIGLTANTGRYLTVYSIDMDGLKSINDIYGHAQGDFAISCMAEAIHHVVSRNGICARYGGDEFACAMITDEPVNLPPDTFRSRIDGYLKNRPYVSEKEYIITASIGSATCPIDESLDLEQLIKVADEAMYTDKKQRRAAK